MSGPEFFQTRMGHKFFEADMPRLINALEQLGSIGEQLEKLANPLLTITPAPSSRFERVPMVLSVTDRQTHPQPQATVNMTTNIDFALLRAQKLRMVELANDLQCLDCGELEKRNKPAYVRALDGLIGLVDWFQDCCAEGLGEEHVFGDLSEDEAQLCPYHQDNLGWDNCTDGWETRCHVAKARAEIARLRGEAANGGG